MSQFAGRSREIIHTVGANHNFNGQWFRDRCFEAGQNAWSDGGKFLKVGAGGASGYAVFGSSPTWGAVGTIYGPWI